MPHFLTRVLLAVCILTMFAGCDFSNRLKRDNPSNVQTQPLVEFKTVVEPFRCKIAETTVPPIAVAPNASDGVAEESPLHAAFQELAARFEAVLLCIERHKEKERGREHSRPDPPRAD